jgi:hypothetical protein
MTDRREQGLLRLRRRGDGRTAAVAAERSRADRRRGGAERDAPASLSLPSAGVRFAFFWYGAASSPASLSPVPPPQRPPA